MKTPNKVALLIDEETSKPYLMLKPTRLMGVNKLQDYANFINHEIHKHFNYKYSHYYIVITNISNAPKTYLL